MSLKNRGHTLIELLVAMALAIVIIGALIPVNGLGLKAADHLQKITLAINQLQQSLGQLESDVSSTGNTGCLLDQNNIRDLLFTQPASISNPLQHSWLSGYHRGNWYPSSPFFNSSNIHSSDAMHLMFADLVNSSSTGNMTGDADRVFYITNCAVGELARRNNAILHTATGSTAHPFQSIIYYVREIDGRLALYRQYINSNGNTRNEPLIDNINQLSIAYAEKTGAQTVVFKNATNVSDWSQVIAVYIDLEIQVEGSSFSISRLIDLPNLNV